MTRCRRSERRIGICAWLPGRQRLPLLPLLLATLAVACGPAESEHADAVGHAHDEQDEAQAEGPHGGRLLTSGAFELEIGIFERGSPPEYRAWARSGGRAVAPSEVGLVVELTRLGGRKDHVAFAPRGDHLVSTSPVAEPHSFDVSVEVVHARERHAWAFESLEGRTQIHPAMAESLGVETEIAGPATLTKTVTVYGRVRANPERVREVRARFDGVVREVHAREGASVREGAKLLSVESDESLNRYTIAAPISGIITQRAANPGELTDGRLLMTITDTSSVWADLSVFPVDRDGIVVGTSVSIKPALGGAAVSGVVSLLETVADPHDQSVVARVVLEDATGELLPGTFVTAEVAVGEYPVALAVKRVGIQSFRDVRVVYEQVADLYEVRMLDLGREAAGWVEVLGGLEPGTRYVTSNSHVIKADIEKSGAAHDH